AAEVSMMASRARALEETARLQALIDKVLADGVPRELLAGLLYLESYGSANPFPYRIPDRDTIMLPSTPAQLQDGRLIPRIQDDEASAVEDASDYIFFPICLLTVTIARLITMGEITKNFSDDFLWGAATASYQI